MLIEFELCTKALFTMTNNELMILIIKKASHFWLAFIKNNVGSS